MTQTPKLDALRFGLAGALACLALWLIAAVLFGLFGTAMMSPGWMMGPSAPDYAPHMGLGGMFGFGLVWVLGCGLFFWLMALLYNRLTS